MKRILSLLIALTVLASISVIPGLALGERSLDEKGTPYYDYELKPVYDEFFIFAPFGEFMRSMGNSSFDLQAFINSEYGALTAIGAKLFLDYPDNMDEGLIAYWREQGLEKKMVCGDDPEDVTKQYYVYVPVDIKDDEKCPVVIVNHGGGTNARTSESYGWCEIAGKERLILIMTEDTSAEFLHEALTAVKSEYPVDSTRVYATGSSAGGMASKAFAAAYPEEVAAIAPMDIGWTFNERDGDAAALSEIVMPMIFITGTADMYNSLPTGNTELSSYDGWNTLVTMQGFEDYTITEAESIALVEDSLNILEHETGLRLPDPEIRHYVNNRAFISRFVNTEGVNTLTVVTVENKVHMPTGHDADIAWEFLRGFSRDPETGKLAATK